MNKVLVISYYFPPAGGPGVQRWLKLANYLCELGTEVHILTVDPQKASYPLMDQSLEHEINSNIHIHRTSTFEILQFYKSFNKKKGLPTGAFANESKNPTFVTKVMRAIRGNLFIPDARKGWNKFALKEAKALIEKENFPFIITTGPPHSTHLVGMQLKEHFPKIKWLADFRDPWSDIVYNDMLYRGKFAQTLDEKLERSVITKADYVSTVGSKLVQLLKNKVNGECPDTKFLEIPNGFDPKDFSQEKEDVTKHEHDAFKIVYLGTATVDYPIIPFMETLAKINRTSRKKVELEFIGQVDADFHENVDRYSSQVKTIFHSYIPHKEVPLRLQEADALLLVIIQKPNNELILTGKLFDYLGSKRPIVAVGPTTGDAAKIIHSTNSGKMVGYDNMDELESTLRQLIEGQHSFTFNSGLYSRKEQAKEIWKLINPA